MRHPRLAPAAAVLAVLTLSATACSTKSGTGTDTAGSDGVKTGPGVTEKTITLGALTDLTGPYASLGKSIVNAQQLYADQLNASGGVCGRTVRITVKDHGYDVQKAVTAFTETEPNVAALSQVVGSPVVSSLQQEIEAKHLLTLPMGWASSLLGHQYVQVVGSTYDIDMINGVDFLVRKAKLKPGDKIGHVYFEGEYGENALAGAKYAAKQHRLSIVEQKIKPTDQDLTAQVTALKQAGVKAILISAGPKQSAALVGTAAAKGFAVPVLSNAPGFAPQLLATPVGPALEKQLYLVSAAPAFSSDTPAIQKLAKDYKAKYPNDPLDTGVISGWNTINVLGEDLKAACKAKDLTREGIAAAHRKQSKLTVFGVSFDFSDRAKPSTYQSFIQKPAKQAAGGLVTVEPAHEVPAARTYPLPKS
ncbi:ABC transporter substrate-binding protein [Streptomyces lunaelactis]|uniref:ABC transporter substrate-binding protein n=1 Tax=Streptomyces lunaelactis TaxID=1535768 RepID=UPI0015847D06|nr:ABC transporter substrate-binding protein [Streptomyces lunaelactis]NUK34936.1 ABC transporter substrate-binding protein [Streptomyces lunaelactis]NUK41678.1 ABC transporter substrate-binding protein [Streptomyces lunaelactis]NUK92042.1 ABC transporter substrate-binding protein [Streptomyces lunaelactis]NUL29590.1 ABC transporter substrate-binding protein [Streptomyces lunaelactis]